MSTSALATSRDTSHRPDWPVLLRLAAEIVNGYDTQVTLRQLFYRLVAAELLPNTTNVYKSLSRYTAEARRAETFPALVDCGRTIHRYPSFDGAAEARKWLASIYRRDRTEGQSVSLYLGVEGEAYRTGTRDLLHALRHRLGVTTSPDFRLHAASRCSVHAPDHPRARLRR